MTFLRTRLRPVPNFWVKISPMRPAYGHEFDMPVPCNVLFKIELRVFDVVPESKTEMTSVTHSNQAFELCKV